MLRWRYAFDLRPRWGGSIAALAQLPCLLEARAERGGALYRMSRRTSGAESEELMRRGKLDICIAAELDPTDSHVLWEIKKIPALRPASMGGMSPLSPLVLPNNALLAGKC